MENQTIKMAVNDKRLVKALKSSFTTKTTFIGELMQNARRAGASRIDFTVVDDDSGLMLVQQDDGCGISDWAGLVSIADSGWDEAIIRDEGAFGIGFLSALCAARHINVRSGDYMLDANTEAVLSMADLEVSPDPAPTEGTKVVLNGIDNNAHAITGAIMRLSKGFPIPVFLDDKEMDRPRACNVESPSSPRWFQTSVGAMRLCDITARKPAGSVVTYLQGLPISVNDVALNPHRESNATIVHLDSTQFTGRLPDRSCIEQDKAETADIILRFQSDCVRSELQRLKKAEDPKIFATRFDSAITGRHADLLNDVPYVPASWIRFLNLAIGNALLTGNRPESWERQGDAGVHEVLSRAQLTKPVVPCVITCYRRCKTAPPDAEVMQ